MPGSCEISVIEFLDVYVSEMKLNFTDETFINDCAGIKVY
jgi:hypothetical protein